MDQQQPPGAAPGPLPGSGMVDPDYGVPILGVLPRTDSPPPIPATTVSETGAPAAESKPPARDWPVQRRVLLPLVLFLATCASTFFAGGDPKFAARPLAYANYPTFAVVDAGAARGPDTKIVDILIRGQCIRFNPRDGLLYMVAVMVILFAHEMGHFLFTLRYRVPASYPLFIPMPISPIGTMGAVIGMDSSIANRKAMFDIGIAGPLAGLIVALPIAWFGIQIATPVPIGHTPDDVTFHAPMLLRFMMQYLHPQLAPNMGLNNPLLMAGWTGMLITGLNMLPVSQLDGGHVAYALFGKGAHALARLVILAAIAFIVLSGVYGWIVMLGVVLFIGIDHPPTHDDSVPISWPRKLIGLASLAIPILCLAPNPMT